MSESHIFLIDDAVKYGVEKAVILQNIRFWLEKVRANDKDSHKHDGYYWTYNSARAFAELFPYFSERKVQRLLTQLEDDGVIMSGNYNKMAYDRTKWYSMPEFSICQNCQMEGSKMVNGITESVQPIPNVIPNVISNVISNNIIEGSKKPKPRKTDFVEFDFTDKQKAKCSEYGIDINSLLEGFKDYAAANGKQYVDWSRAFNTWINNHITWNKLKPVNQSQLGGNNNAKQSKLAELEEYINSYGTEQEIRHVN